jgi:hypothetical protein
MSTADGHIRRRPHEIPGPIAIVEGPPAVGQRDSNAKGWAPGNESASRERERLARRVARMMNSYVVPDVPPFTRRELVTLAAGAIVIIGLLSMLILGAAVQSHPR